MSNATTQWTIKGLSQDIIDLSRKAAKERGVKLGRWVESALRTALKSEEERVDEIFERAAKIQKKNFDALVQSGFTPEQALVLVANRNSN